MTNDAKKAAAHEALEGKIEIYTTLFRGMIKQANIEPMTYDYNADRQRLLDQFPQDKAAIIQGEMEAQKK